MPVEALVNANCQLRKAVVARHDRLDLPQAAHIDRTSKRLISEVGEAQVRTHGT